MENFARQLANTTVDNDLLKQDGKAITKEKSEDLAFDAYIGLIRKTDFNADLRGNAVDFLVKMCQESDEATKVMQNSNIDTTKISTILNNADVDFKKGKPVVVVDDEDIENEGDLIIAGSLITTDSINFIIRNTSGVVCVPMESEYLDRLNLSPMTLVSEDKKGTAFNVSVDASV